MRDIKEIKEDLKQEIEEIIAENTEIDFHTDRRDSAQREANKYAIELELAKSLLNKIEE
jgi:predicted nuclease with TOPRIM domain